MLLGQWFCSKKPTLEKEHNRCCHATTPTGSKSPSTTAAWWPMPGCSFRPPWRGTLPELVRQRLDLGDAPGRANTSDKMMTLVASALAGGDCIDDADVLRTGGTASTLGGTVKAPSTLGTFLRSFRWGHVRQLDRVSRESAGPGLAGRGGTRRRAPDH